MAKSKNTVAGIAIVCTVVIAVVFVLGTIWMGQSTKKDADRAARAVSLMYLDELAGRREQVVENNLQSSIQTIRVAIDLLTQEDLSDKRQRSHALGRERRGKRRALRAAAGRL